MLICDHRKKGGGLWLSCEFHYETDRCECAEGLADVEIVVSRTQQDRSYRDSSRAGWVNRYRIDPSASVHTVLNDVYDMVDSRRIGGSYCHVQDRVLAL